ncbi:SRPBCC family protein [Ureibacillus sp. 179-F W5.1 NHS]|uniref:SRPBCC family protein n=1 Tax=Lysinibacillus halotolerans TaxID=1368476 RepID=A0A3M8HFS7_9BACI|nr:SRPBCC family protein [Lysinibacillus halotolerans]RND01300.1 SRPBCC family protein [Lysinibacillus halotolerans]
MKSWSKEIVIHASIEKIWKLFDGNVEEMQKIMPQVVSHEPLKLTSNKVGSVYLQKYREGKRIQEYEVKTLEYENECDYKKLTIGFNLAQWFNISAQYELEKIDDQKTLFKYKTTNQPLKWFLKPLVKFASDKPVIQFMGRVKKVAEADLKDR